MAARKRQVNFRLTEVCCTRLAELAARTGLYQNMVLEIAVAKLHQQKASQVTADVVTYVGGYMFDEPAKPAESDDDETLDVSEDV